MIRINPAPDLRANLTKAVEDLRLQSDVELRWLSENIVERAQELTPVDTGRLASSWELTRRRAPTTPRVGIVLRVLRKLRLARDPKNFSTIWISNRAPYASIVEYGLYTRAKKPYRRKFRGRWMTGIWSDGQGYSVQAPGGMLRLAIAQVIREYRTRR